LRAPRKSSSGMWSRSQKMECGWASELVSSNPTPHRFTVLILSLEGDTEDKLKHSIGGALASEYGLNVIESCVHLKLRTKGRSNRKYNET